ncbi:MAG: hypothetical protein JOY85_14190, partial [Acidobacteriaceae bacterium]|nr:hypothetical protein [Acidobacteriaceae bacterium]
VEYQLLRIAGETLLNAGAHAQAKNIEVRLAIVHGELQLTIVDDGVGFSQGTQRPFGHFGLIGMRERADEIDAKLIVTSSPGSGTTVAVTVPLRNGGSPAESNAPFSLAHHKE